MSTTCDSLENELHQCNSELDEASRSPWQILYMFRLAETFFYPMMRTALQFCQVHTVYGCFNMQ